MFAQTVLHLQRQRQVSLMRCCRLFGISRQAVYQSDVRLKERVATRDKVVKLVLNERRILPRSGTRKLHYLLKDDFVADGIKMGRDSLFDTLRQYGLLIKPERSYTKTTNSKHWMHKHPNLLKDMCITRAEQVYVSDITYVKSHQRTHYLSLVTDAYSRRIMGYHLSDDLSAESVVRALIMAIKNRITDLPLIHHSDRGLQYCSEVYQKVLDHNHIKPSMTDGYDCYQNALAERVNGILKQEFLFCKCNNKQQLNELIKQSVEIYNNKRPHAALHMKTPNLIHKNSGVSNNSAVINTL